MNHGEHREHGEETFLHELEVFRGEVESLLKFSYAYKALNKSSFDHQPILQLLNTAPSFWLTIRASLQNSAFITLGRIFDTDSNHSVHKLLRVAQNNLNIFSKEAILKRKPPEWWVQEFLDRAYVPTAQDFRDLRKEVSKYKKIYEEGFKDIRHKIYAHKELSHDTDINALFEHAKTDEFEGMVNFLCSLHECLWNLFHNARKPNPNDWDGMKDLQDRMMREAEDFLLSAAKNSALSAPLR